MIKTEWKISENCFPCKGHNNTKLLSDSFLVALLCIFPEGIIALGNSLTIKPHNATSGAGGRRRGCLGQSQECGFWLVVRGFCVLLVKVSKFCLAKQEMKVTT